MKVYKFEEPSIIRNGAKPIYYYIDKNGCYICVSHRKDRDGYFKVDRNGIEWQMHRYIYSITKGEIPKGYDVCHICDNPNCSCPDHLEAKSHWGNMQDMVKRNRGAKTRIRLSEEQKLEIAKSELTIPQLALQYNVSHSTIINIKRKHRIKSERKRSENKPIMHSNDKSANKEKASFL